MALQFSDSLRLLLVLFLFISGKVMSNGKCYQSATPGGCPDEQRCVQTCRPCYRGVGRILAYCVAPSGPIIFWECRCVFFDGAPCPPPGGPKCPGNPILSPNSTTLL